MRKKKTMLPTVAEAKRFVEEVIRRGFDIDVLYNRVTIDAKSTLGILGLDLTRILITRFSGVDGRFGKYLDTILPHTVVTAA